MTEKIRGSVAARIDNIVFPEPNTGCWIWGGAVSKTGYGTMTVSGRTKMAHRASYEAHKGVIHNGLHIDHKCRVRCCVNPDHLEAVTVQENNRRAPRQIILASHCKSGHPFSGENLVMGSQQRRCRKCDQIRALKYYHARKNSHV